MSVIYESDRVCLVNADCVEFLKTLPENSLDSCVCDPPYDLTAGKKGGSGEASLNPNSPAGRSRIGTGFMGKSWDGTGIAFDPKTWAEVLRVLKPGGHLLAFGGTRTFHRLACAIEDAGFELRDSIHWVYGSGFPKSLDVSKAMDKAAGAERIRTGRTTSITGARENPSSAIKRDTGMGRAEVQINIETAPATDDAKKWQGFGTALKPAHEPIVIARKPLVGTVAANVERFGTGAVNVDGCRVATGNETIHTPQSDPTKRTGVVGSDLGISRADVGRFREAQLASIERTNTLGRWPPNMLLVHSPECRRVGEREVVSNGHHPASRGAGGVSTSGHAGQVDLEERHARGEMMPVYRCAADCPVAELDRQSGLDRGGAFPTKQNPSHSQSRGAFGGRSWESRDMGKGGASRFFPTFEFSEDDFPFRYIAKASRSEREYGCENLPARSGAEAVDREEGSAGTKSPRAGAGRTAKEVHNFHPTIKPIAVMRWIVRLATAPGGTVLDPFMGSGSCGIAALREGFSYLGIEKDTEEGYMAIAEARVKKAEAELTETTAEKAVA